MVVRSHPVVTLVLIASVALGACSGDDGDGSARPRPRTERTTTSTSTTRVAVDGKLVIGQLAPLTGPIATLAPAFTTPVQMAVDEINLLGGVDGSPVTLAVADDATTPTTAATAFDRLVDTDHVDAIVGPSSSEIAAELIPNLARRSVVVCSGSNAAGALSDLDSGGLYFRTVPGDRLQARALAALVARDGRRRPAVLAADGSPTQFRDQLVRALRGRDARRPRATVVGFTAATAPAAVATVLEATPDAVIVLGTPESAAPALRALSAAGSGPAVLPTYGSDMLQSPELGRLVDPAAPGSVAGIRGTTPAGLPGGIDHPLVNRMLGVGVEPFFSGAAYDCTMLIALAAVAAESDDADAIARNLPRLLTGGTDCTAFAECADLLRRDRTIHYRGAFSRFDRWQRFEPGTGTYDVWIAGADGAATVQSADQQIQA